MNAGFWYRLWIFLWDAAGLLLGLRLLVTGFFGYRERPRKGWDGARSALWRIGALILLLYFYDAANKRTGGGFEDWDIVLLGALEFGLLLRWTARIEDRRGWAFLIALTATEELTLFLNLFDAASLLLADDLLEASGSAVRTACEILRTPVTLLFLFWMARVSARRRQRPMSHSLVVVALLLCLFVDGIPVLTIREPYLEMGQPFLAVRLLADGSVSRLLILIASFGILLLAMLLLVKESESAYFREQNAASERYLEAQSEHYERMEEKSREIRKMRHDMNNRLAVCRELCRKGEYRELEEYLADVSEAAAGMDTDIDVGNEFANAILNEKKRKAERLGISAEISGTFPGGLLSALDTCTILANILDNAIEAAEQLPKERRSVRMEFRRTPNYLLIRESNPCGERPEIQEGTIRTTKRDASGHGFGIPSIREAAERYDGECAIRAEEVAEDSAGTERLYEFTIEVMIPIAQEREI